MGESFRFKWVNWRLSVRGRRADSTLSDSRCEEKKPGATLAPGLRGIEAGVIAGSGPMGTPLRYPLAQLEEERRPRVPRRLSNSNDRPNGASLCLRLAPCASIEEAFRKTLYLALTTTTPPFITQRILLITTSISASGSPSTATMSA